MYVCEKQEKIYAKTNGNKFHVHVTYIFKYYELKPTTVTTCIWQFNWQIFLFKGQLKCIFGVFILWS